MGAFLSRDEYESLRQVDFYREVGGESGEEALSSVSKWREAAEALLVHLQRRQVWRGGSATWRAWFGRPT